MLTDLSLKDLLSKRNLANSCFVRLYTKLLTNRYNELNNEELNFLLKTAVVFLNQSDTKIQQFGYSIILRYSNIFNDYTPLYEVSLNLGFVPIAKFIENNVDFKSTFINTIMAACMNQLKEVDENTVKYLTIQQSKLKDFISNNKNFTIVAPTSYGKSELLINYIVKHCQNKNIGIIVPTKALLAQTKSRLSQQLIQKGINIKIVTHPDMYVNDEKFVCALTQERLLTILTENDSFCLDELIVDEAHNLLSGEDRGILLAQLILLMNKRNPNMNIKYISPFIEDTNSLTIKYFNKNLNSSKISEFLKIERYFVYEDNLLKQYDQFLNTVLETKYSDLDVYDFICHHKSNKNIIYSNKPRDVEFIAKQLQSKEGANDIQDSKEYMAIKEYLDSDYNLLDCMKHGIVYHHGGMPDNIKLYVEHIYKTNPLIKHIVTTSTLLEGVNIPANTIFMLSIKKGLRQLTHSNFMNLTGRVCRFKEIFNYEHGSLKLLEPKIYLLKSNFTDQRTNLEKYIQKTTKIIQENVDDIDNPLLVNSLESDTLSVEHIEFVENIEKNTIGDAVIQGINYAQSDIAKLCFKNIVKEFNIIQNERTLINNYERFKTYGIFIDDLPKLMNAIYDIFLKDIQLDDDNMKRMQEESTRNFYLIILNWLSEGAPYKSLISKFVSYWSRPDREDNDIYVGKRWGEKTKYGGFRPLFVDVSQKNRKDLINLAIVRIKEEKEFVELHIMKFVEILKELNHIEESLYNKIKYGSTDKKVIYMLQNGFSLDLATRIKEKYEDTIVFNDITKEVYTTSSTIEKMKQDKENDILIFEAQYYKN